MVVASKSGAVLPIVSVMKWLQSGRVCCHQRRSRCHSRWVSRETLGGCEFGF
ncbi:hypothetical protein BZL30_4227 [Mycobacterium kansasii]|uniref:Uncharacterized protein n=1 Tax=Mycobacterium kansasii TaxID=1768 RepID=A0A1V3XDB7_MYCKA|nr:hypothetical protein BZL30_4227 [Mycobacterium kansasii]